MKKKIFVLTVSALLLLSACSSLDENGSTDSSNNGIFYTDDGTGSIGSVGSVDPPPQIENSTTAANVSAVEDQPENTVVMDTSQEEATAPIDPVPVPDGFPAPYPAGTVEDEELLTEFKEKIESAEIANSVLYGANTLIPLSGAEQNGFRRISEDYAADYDALIERMYEGFKYSFWEAKYDEEVENILPELIHEEDDGGILLSVAEGEEMPVIEISSAVITYLTDYDAEVVALGVVGDKYIWRTYDMLNGVRGWVVRMYDDESVTGEVAVFSRLLLEKSVTLDKIFGNGEPIKDENGDWNPQLVTIEDDLYGHGFYNGLEIEPFMTVEEMRQFIRDTFTSEIAESYIKLYVNRTYVEKDGKLYMISGSVLPQMGEFSLDNYENRSMSSFDVTSMVEWTDGNKTYTLPITIAYEDGMWKLDTRLPMREDRVIE